jgi:hypothetical protein
VPNHSFIVLIFDLEEKRPLVRTEIPKVDGDGEIISLVDETNTATVPGGRSEITSVKSRDAAGR